MLLLSTWQAGSLMETHTFLEQGTVLDERNK